MHKHNARWWRTGTTDLRERRKPQRLCDVPGCDRPHLARGFCKPHYRLDEYARKGAEILAKRKERERATPPKVWTYTPEQMERRRQQARDRYARNPEPKRSRARKFYWENPEERREASRQWAQQNKDHVAEVSRRYAEQNAERLAQYYRQWALDNPHRRRASHATRKARRRGATVGVVDYDLILAKYGDHCHICERPIGPEDEIHFDHVIPLSRGGEHSNDNIRPAHAKCNLRKSAKLPSELRRESVA